MDWDRHVYFSEPACLINHSCEPNTGVRDNPVGGYDFIALKAIVEGEEITFDYATTEYVSVAVKDCLCGTRRCRGRSGGFELLDAKHPALQAGLIAGYLKNVVGGHVRPALCRTPNRKSRWVRSSGSSSRTRP
jgi:hypothetical protein